MPFLFKLLAADRPLSIQVHPTKLQAEQGFEEETRRGIDSQAANRNYRDNNHKPELICAISEFWALKGFKNTDEIKDCFEKLKHIKLIQECLNLLSDSPEPLKDVFNRIVNMDSDEKPYFLSELKAVCKEYKSENCNYYWILKASEYFPDDTGLGVMLLMNVVKLNPGESMFLGCRNTSFLSIRIWTRINGKFK